MLCRYCTEYSKHTVQNKGWNVHNMSIVCGLAGYYLSGCKTVIQNFFISLVKEDKDRAMFSEPIDCMNVCC